MTDNSQPNGTQKSGDKTYWLDRPENVDKIFWGIIVLCAALFLGDAFYHKHPYFSIEKLFGFYGIFGFFACVVLVLASRELQKFLKRDEDYYEETNDDAEGSH